MINLPKRQSQPILSRILHQRLSNKLKENDEIEVRDSSKQLTTILSSVASKEREVPEYVVVDHKQLTAKYTRVPKMEEIPYPAIMEPNLVVEYYSR